MKNIYKLKAFSLIEMMVVLTIIVILTALTAPNFSNQIKTTRRTEAKTSLLDYAMRFEEYYGTNFSYTNADTYYGLSTQPQTENGYYRLTANITDSGNSYTITATAIGSQASDTNCSTITINNIGEKTPTNCL